MDDTGEKDWEGGENCCWYMMKRGLEREGACLVVREE